MFFKISTILISICLATICGLTNDPGFVHEVSSTKTICHGVESPYLVRIQSEDINGLVQLEFKIPQGLNVQVVNSQNSKVTQRTNSLSLLWENMEEEEININLAFTSDVVFIIFFDALISLKIKKMIKNLNNRVTTSEITYLR